jgi:hypothetical protein
VSIAVLLTPIAATAQTTVLFEGFEGAFPADNGWAVGDGNSADIVAYWDEVTSSFGTGGGTHSGLRMGYCAGLGFGGTATNPTYQKSMQSFMRRSIDLSNYAGAELTFWYRIPSMTDYAETLRVYVDGSSVFSRDSSATNWTESRINLSSFVGGAHTLGFEFNSGPFSAVHEGAYLDDIRVIGYSDPPNDLFGNATVLSGSSGVINGFNNGATKEASEPIHAGNAGGHSVWYRWTASNAAPVSFDTSGSSFDTLLAVYTGSSVATLTLIGENDDLYGGANSRSRVRFTPVPGTTYRIAVDGYSGRTGPIRLSWKQGALPDLLVWGPAAAPAISVNTLDDSDCSVVEGLVAGGTRKLVRFSTETRNIGSADLVLGDASGNPLFTPGLCHSHNHFNGYLAQRVRDSDGNVVALATKAGSCLEDDSRWKPASSPTPAYFCSYQGIQAGWSHVSGSLMPGQWVDVTGLPPGNYQLELEVNPDHVLEEANYGNNITQVPFTIPVYSNDDFVNATRLGNAFETLAANTTAATKELGEPAHAGNAGGHSIWYGWTAASGGPVAFDTRESDFDTLLAVYTGNSFATLQVIGTNDNIDVGDHASRVTFTSVPGNTYWLAVDGSNGASGNVRLHVHPGNDDFADCLPLAGPAGVISGINQGATYETGEPYHAGVAGERSAWYCWDAPINGLVEFNTVGSTFDTLLAVYTGSSLAGLTTVAANDDISSVNRCSRVMFPAKAGVTYRIAVDGFGGAIGVFNLTWGYPCRLAGANAVPGRFVITLEGVPLSNYAIEGSDDLQFWVRETSVTTDVSGHAAYNADLVGLLSHRFYRAAPVPP